MTQYNALRFPGQPDTVPGLAPCGYYYAADLTVGSSILDPGTPALAVAAVSANPPAPGAPIILDIEYAEDARGRIVYDYRQDIRKPRRGETPQQCCDAVRSHMDAMADVVLAVKRANPGSPVIPYAGLSIEDEYAARCGDYPHIATYARRYDDWLLAQQFLASTRLRESVDGVLCPLFLSSELQWASGAWERSAVRTLEQAAGYGLPVYAQLSPFLKNKWVFVAPESYSGMVGFCEDQGVHIVHWATGNHRVPPMDWSEFSRADTVRTFVRGAVPVGEVWSEH